MSKTIKVKAADLSGVALDWAVASAIGLAVIIDHQGWVREPGHCDAWRPSADWSQGGPIIERERIGVNVTKCGSEKHAWIAYWPKYVQLAIGRHTIFEQFGPTPLIAAMRCYVAAKLGDEIEVPAELVEGAA